VLCALIALVALSFKVATGHSFYSASSRTTYDFVECQTLNDTFVAFEFPPDRPIRATDLFLHCLSAVV
jgi:hypothetical protein